MRFIPIAALLTGCRVSPPSGVPDQWPGAGGSTNPHVHQYVEVDGTDDTAPSPQDDTAPPVQGSPVVVVLVTDGARIDETFGEGSSSVTDEPTRYFMPRIREQLWPQGTLFTRALNTGVTVTSEGHAELLTGRRVPLGNFPSDDGPGQFMSDFPTLFEALRGVDGLPEAAAVVAGNSTHMQALAYSSHPTAGRDLAATHLFVSNPSAPTLPASDDAVVIDRVREWMDDYDTRLVVANLHQMDRAGHADESLTAYASRIKEVDDPIVEFWESVQADPRYADRTTLIVVADHGRHRNGTVGDHRHHGDSCSGCREIPLFMVGPRVRRGVTLSSPALLADVGATMAELLDVPLPMRHGMVLRDALVDDVPARAHPGDIRPAGTPDLRLTQRWTDASETRSIVTLNGEALSSPHALHAEAPVSTFRGPQGVACWRELGIGDGLIETWPWTPHCVRIDPAGGVTSLRFPATNVSPYFAPSLAFDHTGMLWAAFVDNVTGTWESTEQRVQVYRWSSDGLWEPAGDGIGDVSYPMNVALLPVSDGALVAYVTSDTAPPTSETVGLEARARYRRHLRIDKVTWLEDDTPSLSTLWRSYTADHFSGTSLAPAPEAAWPGWSRVGSTNHPALGQQGASLYLGFVAIDADTGEPSLRVQRSIDGGQTWAAPITLDDAGVMTHLSPVFVGGKIAWARMRDELVEICSWGASEGQACTSTSGTHIDGLHATVDGWSAGLLVEGTWQVAQGTW